MSSREYAEMIRQSRARLEAAAPGAFATAALTTLAVVKDRSIANGIFVDSEPGKTAEYSTKPVYASSFKGKTLNNAGKRYISTHKMGTWGGLRTAQGLPSDTVNLSYTNKLWRSIGVRKLNRDGRRLSVTIATGDPSQVKKLQGLVERFGMFLNPTPPESRNMVLDMIDELTQTALPWMR